MPKISVLVPVYNAERFLPACIDSILAQTYTDFELLCADDASSDHSVSILQDYSRKDKRIKIFLQSSNIGAAQNRNLLLQKAQGQYIAFVDADDIIFPTYLEHLYSQAVEKDADIVRGLFIAQDINSGEQFACETHCKGFLRKIPNASATQRLQAALDDRQVWLKLIKTSLIRANELMFRPNARAEDFPFEVLLYQYAGNIVFTSQHLYLYRIGNSQSLSSGKALEAYGILENMIFLCQELARRNLTEPAFYGRIVDLTLDAVKRIRKFSLPASYKWANLCRQAFDTVEKQRQYCCFFKRMRLWIVCRLARIVKDAWLPYYACYFVYWFR